MALALGLVIFRPPSDKSDKSDKSDLSDSSQLVDLLAR